MYESERRCVDEVSERRREKGVESLGSLAAGIDEGLEEYRLKDLDLGVRDDLRRMTRQFPTGKAPVRESNRRTSPKRLRLVLAASRTCLCVSWNTRNI